MKIIEATIFALKIPFTESFSHSLKSRTYSDSIVVKLKATDGTIGYGEAIARPYVTGETVESCLDFMVSTIWEKVKQIDYPEPEADISWLYNISDTIPTAESKGVIAFNAAKAGFELALLDCLLKSRKLSLAAILPPKRNTVIYSGAITSSSIEKAVKNAKSFKLFGLQHIKVKITGEDDFARLDAIRQAVGQETSLRIDGNGIYDFDAAVNICHELAQLKIDSAEQLIGRSTPETWAKLKELAPIPQMVDESLVTIEDAKALIAANSCDFFNLRISKCGGIAQTIRIAQLAQTAGVKLQLGCQVGETAILSAAGRHLATWLEDVTFVEGSYGNLLLSEDISIESIRFGNGGKAGLLRQSGLGIEVKDEVLEKYAVQRYHC
ncbi:MAG: enolase [Calothrix sp. C42_A2020_038]|nr:enolase [Calothrix sp. C42_A2020_038]